MRMRFYYKLRATLKKGVEFAFSRSPAKARTRCT